MEKYCIDRKNKTKIQRLPCRDGYVMIEIKEEKSNEETCNV